MNKQIRTAVTIVVGVLVAIYLLIVFITAMFNAGNLEHTCTKGGRTWIANPLTIGTTGVCK